jgi:hypothetical protein
MAHQSSQDDWRRPPRWAIGDPGGQAGLPLQEQHRDHDKYHVVALMRSCPPRPRKYNHTRVTLRLCGHGSPTLFSSTPPPSSHPLEYYHDMFSLKVNRGDVLLFDGSIPHGQGAIPTDCDTWTIFATLHEHNTFNNGFPDQTINHSSSIYRALTKNGSSWDLDSLEHFRAHPALLGQV